MLGVGGVLVSCPVGWKKSDGKRLELNEDHIWLEIVWLCMKRKKDQWLEFCEQVTGLYIHPFIHYLISLASQLKRSRNKTHEKLLKT